jgi:hypothetical protein
MNGLLHVTTVIETRDHHADKGLAVVGNGGSRVEYLPVTSGLLSRRGWNRRFGREARWRRTRDPSLQASEQRIVQKGINPAGYRLR